ncbi:MAG: hypothetical protein M3R36_11830 [Bacteroidota bacterium]|nr:hypothetical protein [Bacteroidota bacterium]
MKKFIILIVLVFLTEHTSIFSQQWSVVPSPNPSVTRNILRGVGSISSNDVWAVGVYDQQPSFTLTQHWDGDNWTVVPSPSPGPQYNELYAVQGLSSNNVYAVGNFVGFPATPQMLVLNWDGTSWTQENTPTVTGGSALESIVIFGPDDIYAGGNKTIGAPGPLVGTLVLHWNGSSWNIESTPNQSDNRTNYITDMKGLSSNDIWAVGYSRRTGENFQAMVLHKTGSDWNIVPVPQPGSENFLYSVDIIAPNDIWATGSYNDGTQYSPLFLHYNGSSWTVVNSPGGGAAVIHNSANDIWSTGFEFVHYDGNVWSLVNAPIPSGGNMGRMTRISSTDMWAVGRYIDGTAFKTLTMHLGNSSTLNLTALIQGFYDPITNQMVSDTARIYLRNVSSPYAIVESAKSVLDSNGNGIFNFTNSVNAIPYYIILKHRNGLETWSEAGNTFTSGNLSYDFTSSSSKAFGNNQILEGTKYCIYNGDVNQDETIDLSDGGLIDNDVFNFISGYEATDVNGDSVIDLSDLEIADNNILNFVSMIRP